MRLSKENTALIFSILLLALFFWFKLDAPLGDFGNYYFGSLFYVDGVSFDVLYDPYSFNALVREMGTQNLYLNFGVFPPITALIFTPATFVSANTAKIIWNVLSAAILLFSLFRLARHLELSAAYLPIILLLFFTPLLSNFYQGQFYMVLLALLMEGWMAYEQGKNWASAIYWGFAALVKVFPLVLIILLLRDKAYKQIVRVFVSVAAIFLISLIFIPLDVWLNYSFSILPKIMEGKFSDPYSSTFQSMSILLQKAFVFDGALNPQPVMDASWIFQWLDRVFKLFILYTVWVHMSNTKNRFGHFAVVLMYAAVFNGYSTVYSLIMLLPLAIYCFQHDSRTVLISIVFLVVALSISVSAFAELPLILQFPRLWLLLVVFVVLVFQKQLQFNWKLSMAIFIIPLVFAWFKPDLTPISEIVELQNPALLTTDYNISDEGIVVTTFDAAGLHQELLPMTIEAIDTTRLKVINEQIRYLDVAIVSSIDRKKKPMLINRSDMYYLSDEGRGVGFYALRKMPMKFEE